MKSIYSIIVFFFVCFMSTDVIAQCTVPQTMPTRGWSITSVRNSGAVPEAGFLPVVSPGAVAVIEGSFPGITNQLMFSGQNITVAQGLRVLVDNTCHPASFNALSSTAISVKLPSDYFPNGPAVIRIVSNNVTILSYNVTMHTRYTPTFSWQSTANYASPNYVSGLVGYRVPGSGNINYAGVITPGQYIGQNVPLNYDLFLIVNMQGWDEVLYSFSASIDGIPITEMEVIHTPGYPYSVGSKLVRLKVPQSLRGVDHTWYQLQMALNTPYGQYVTGLNPQILLW